MKEDDIQNKILNLLPRFEKIREIKDKWKVRKKERRLKDLFAKIHVYNKHIKINLPNLYAITEIENKYESIENLDLSNKKHLAFVLVVLENQENLEFAKLSEDEKNDLVLKRLQQIPAGQYEDYINAIYEIFIMQKKNSTHKQMDILQQALAILDGEKSQSGSQKKPD